MARRFVARSREIVLGATALVCATAIACAGKSVRDDEDGDNAGEGGTRPSGGSSGARGGVAGTSSGGDAGTSSGGASGTVSGGASGTASGGASGTAAGGASGTRGGSSGSATGGTSTGGSSGSNTCPMCTPVVCTTTLLPTEVVNDFDDLYFAEGTDQQPIGIFGILDAAGMLKPEWWTGYFSGSYTYPTIPESCSGEPTPRYPLVRNEMGGALRVTGTVGGPSGFGVWVGPCITDMSAGYGIMFTIGGRVGSGALDMKIGTSSNTNPDACQVGRGKCVADLCEPPSVRFAIPGTPEPIALPWAAFSNGTPSASVDPHEVVELRWDFEWAPGMTPYEVDVTLDDVMLVE